MVHPHYCGGAETLIIDVFRTDGSSPRTRGILVPAHVTARPAMLGGYHSMLAWASICWSPSLPLVFPISPKTGLPCR